MKDIMIEKSISNIYDSQLEIMVKNCYEQRIKPLKEKQKEKINEEFKNLFETQNIKEESDLKLNQLNILQ